MNEQIYKDYHDKVLWFIQSKVNDRDLAEDLCSDVFLKVYEKLDTFDPSKAQISTWIFTITRNRLTDYYRSRRVFEEIPEDLSDHSSFEDEICNQETLKVLAKALKQLDERERDIIVFHYYSRMTLKEVAEKMGISYAYVKILHNKALSNLKGYF